MSFTDDIADVLILQFEIDKNQREFEVIHNRIVYRVLKFPTPVEMFKMWRLLRKNTPMLKRVAIKRDRIKTHLDKQKSDTQTS